jgi:hypothetical protein
LEVSKMKKRFIIFYVATFCIVAGLSFATPASSTVLFYEDFEDELDIIADPHRDWVPDTQGTGSMALSTEQVRAGSKSYKFSCTGSATSRVRQELCIRNLFNDGSSSRFGYGDEHWIGFSIFLAEGYENPSDPGTWGPMHHQYHGTIDTPPTCDPSESGRHGTPLHIRTASGNWKTEIRWNSEAYSTTPNLVTYIYDSYSVGQWTDFVIHIIWNYDNNGLTQIWKDGVLVVDRSGGNCYNDVLGPYMKIGIYGRLDDGQVITIYYDELRIGDENSSYSEVAPGGKKSEKPLPPINVEVK